MATKKFTDEEARLRKNERQKAYQRQTNYAAINKYHKEQTKSITIRFMNKTESDIINWLESQPNKSGYIKQLIRADMAQNEKSS